MSGKRKEGAPGELRRTAKKQHPGITGFGKIKKLKDCCRDLRLSSMQMRPGEVVEVINTASYTERHVRKNRERELYRHMYGGHLERWMMLRRDRDPNESTFQMVEGEIVRRSSSGKGSCPTNK